MENLDLKDKERKKPEREISSGVGFLTVIVIAITVLFFFFQNLRGYLKDALNIPLVVRSPRKEVSEEYEITLEEKATIDVWIQENDLNKYSDPLDTMYAGGTPLFDESTGETISRYEYIIKKHPDRPWNEE